MNEKGELPVLTLSPEWEKRLLNLLTRTESGTYLAVDPKTFEELIGALTQACQNSMATHWTVLCASNMRFHFRKLIERFMPQLSVVSPNDIPPNIQIVSLGVVGQ